MAPLDPGRHWLAAGITGLPRQREWDAVATADAPGTPGDEAEFVALPDGRLLTGEAPSVFDPAPLAEALRASLDPPYRAVAVRREELWAVGACAIEVAELTPDPGGDEIEVIRDRDRIDVRIGGLPSLARVPGLERLGEAKSTTYVVRARRLAGPLFEVEVEPLQRTVRERFSFQKVRALPADREVPPISLFQLAVPVVARLAVRHHGS